MKTLVYSGWLYEQDLHGEYHDALCVKGLQDKEDSDYFSDVLADAVSDDMDAHGNYLSVRYFISDVEAEVEQLEEVFLKTVMGLSDAEFDVVYSDVTGYLWTDEWLIIGAKHSDYTANHMSNSAGHDLLAELRSNLGKYLWLEITFSYPEEIPGHR